MCDLNLYLTEIRKRIDAHLDHLLPKQDVPYQSLLMAGRYSLFSGGKRLRPVLALATVEVLGGDQNKALTPACCLELIHTYSLIHDDLPSMDNDDTRRGKPTLHRVFPEAHAVLAGDLLLTKTFQLLTQAPFLSDREKVQLIEVISTSAGDEGMLGGQVMDIEASAHETTLENLESIHKSKTGRLITASIQMGAICANASDQEMEALISFGENIGLAFQIIDDVLDVTHFKKKEGLSSDQINGKATYVSLMGVTKAKDEAQKYLSYAMDALDRLPQDTSRLNTIATSLVDRKI
ncbi:MAG: polyprenyl synthetase family protein [Waddliaceae bacterium]